MTTKIVFLIIDCLMNYNRIYFKFNEFSEKWELNLWNSHIPKIILSILANLLLSSKFPADPRRASKHLTSSRSFKLALGISFLAEVLFETESKDNLSVNCLLYSVIYDDLFDELFDKSSMLWFEIIRLALLLSLGKNLWRAALMYIRDLLTLAVLNRVKGMLFMKIHTTNHEMDLQQSIKADYKRMINEAPSAFFILKTTQELNVMFMNQEASSLSSELRSLDQVSINMEGSPDLNKATSPDTSPLPIDQALAWYLNVEDRHPFIQNLLIVSKAGLEYPDIKANVPLSDSRIAYDTVVKYVEWEGNMRIMLEIRKSNYQHVRMTHELLDVCNRCTSAAEKKFAKLIKFIDFVAKDSDSESVRAVTLLNIYKNSVADYIRLMKVYEGALTVSVREDRTEKVHLDRDRLKQILVNLGNYSMIINKNRNNALHICSMS